MFKPHFQGVSIENVVNSGPGLVFITYPEVVLKLPGGPIWAVTFFVMLVVSQVAILLSVLFSWLLYEIQICEIWLNLMQVLRYISFHDLLPTPTQVAFIGVTNNQAPNPANSVYLGHHHTVFLPYQEVTKDQCGPTIPSKGGLRHRAFRL